MYSFFYVNYRAKHKPFFRLVYNFEVNSEKLKKRMTEIEGKMGEMATKKEMVSQFDRLAKMMEQVILQGGKK